MKPTSVKRRTRGPAAPFRNAFSVFAATRFWKQNDSEPVGSAVADVGYSARAVDAAPGSARRQHSDRWVLRAIISWPLAIAALLVSLLLPQTAGTGWIVLVLAVVVEFAGGWPFLRNAARLLRHGAVSMDTLIAFGWAPAESLAAVLAKNGR